MVCLKIFPPKNKYPILKMQSKFLKHFCKFFLAFARKKNSPKFFFKNCYVLYIYSNYCYSVSCIPNERQRNFLYKFFFNFKIITDFINKKYFGYHTPFFLDYFFSHSLWLILTCIICHFPNSVFLYCNSFRGLLFW